MANEPTPVLKRHREEAVRLLGLSPAAGGGLDDVYAHRWIAEEAVPDWWFEEHEGGERLPIVAAGLANAESAIHARYAGLVERVRESCVELRATGGDQNVLGWLERGLKELNNAE